MRGAGRDAGAGADQQDRGPEKRRRASAGQRSENTDCIRRLTVTRAPADEIKDQGTRSGLVRARHGRLVLKGTVGVVPRFLVFLLTVAAVTAGAAPALACSEGSGESGPPTVRQRLASPTATFVGVRY